MFNKVKKFGSKLFGDTPSSNGKEEGHSPSSHHERPSSVSKSPFSLKSFSKSSAVADMETDAKSSFSRKNLAGSSASLQVEGSSGSKSALPPVHVNGSFTQQQAPRAPAAIAAMISPTNTGRRKSTPAALDMALRTAEGKAAIEELINSGGKKQMVFGQYFGSTGKPTPPTTLDKSAASRFKQAPPGPMGTGPAMADKVINTVPEDEDTHMASAPSPTGSSPHVLSPKSPHPPPMPPPHSHAMPPASASSPHIVPASASAHLSASASVLKPAAGKRPMEVDTHAPAAVPAAPAAAIPPQPSVQAPPTPAASSQPTPMQVEEEPPPAKQTKILALAQQLPNGMSRKYWSLADYSIVRKMYTGYASTVYQATCKKSLEQVALKVYHMENLCELNHYQVYREIRVHAGLQHQHIIALFCAFQEGNDVVLVQEYAEGGDLYRLLHKNGGRLSERQAVEMVLHPFLLSLHYLHTHGIMHRDIKPENVLFTEHRVLKLADFGLAIDLNEERAVTRAGTLDYMAPEVLRCPPKNLPQENKNNAALHYNNSVDAWAVGVFAYELIVGFPPFAGESQLDSVDKIIHSTPEFPDKVSELAKAFIIAALKKHPGDRPTVMEMLHHPWIRTYQRRTSVRIPQTTRRRSSVVYAPGQAMPSHMEEGPMPGGPPNMDNMTPEEIEDMIKRLQMAKAGHGMMGSSGAKMIH